MALAVMDYIESGYPGFMFFKLLIQAMLP